MVVVEKYPELKSDANFRDLQAQLEGTENRITVARQRYIKSVQEYNTTVVQFPTNLAAMIFGFKEKPQFTVDNEKAIATPPKVDFSAPPAAEPAKAAISPSAPGESSK
jgi:LemA protein